MKMNRIEEESDYLIQGKTRMNNENGSNTYSFPEYLHKYSMERE